MVHPVTVDDQRDEVRLGLVLYGGVSLAIYINGVAQEFWNVVKGRGPYRLLKGLINADVVVDIVSGTSAGGINGVLLAYALANDRDFKYCSTLWREHADFQRMLRAVDAKNPPSILDGERYFHEHLADLYRRMPAWDPERRERKWESPVEALDLFVTGTDYDGEVTTRVDSLGHALSIKDHRKVFKLKYRSDRDEHDFAARWDPRANRVAETDADEAKVRALATISRCTASFPGAFPPTTVEGAEPSAGTDVRDARAADLVRMWGAFTKRTDFLDGGVLDNKPFTYTIRDIYLRTAERHVVRKLFYVEPDPEHFVPVKRTTSPDILSVVLSSLVGIPGYESIAQDLREIDDRNARLHRYEEIVSIVRKDQGNTSRFSPSPTQRAMHLKSRASQMRDRFVDGIRTSPGTWATDEGTRTIRDLADRLIGQFDTLDDPAGLLARYDADYAMRRLFYVTYELYGRLYPERAASRGAPSRPLVNLLAALNREIQVLKVVQYAIERFQAALGALPGGIGGALDLWTRVQGLLEYLLAWPVSTTQAEESEWSTGHDLPAPDDDAGWAAWLPDSHIKRLRQTLGDRLVAIDESLRTRVPLVAPSGHTLIQALAQDAVRILEHFLGARAEDRAIRATWDNFSDIDAYLFPLEYLSDLQEKDRIEIVRVSPLDAKLGFAGRDAPEKIAGDAFYHFGGFFKRSWRANDILWGRLDAVDLLFECLLTPARVRAAVETPERQLRLMRYLTGSDDVSPFGMRTVVNEIFPHSTDAVRERIAAWVTNLVATPDSWKEAVDVLEQGEMQEILVRAAQLEILEEDLPDVIQDAVDETLEWGTTKRPARGGADDGFQRLDVDSLVGDVIKQMASQVIRPRPEPAAAADSPAPASAGSGAPARVQGAYQMVRRVLRLPTPARQRLIEDAGGFFQTRYRVGGEDLRRNIPPLVLVQTFAHALLVTKNAFLGALASRRGSHAVVVPPPVRWALEYPLWLAYALSALVRRQPGLGALHLTFAVVAAVVFAIGVVWREEIWWPDDGGVKLRWAAVFIVVPVLTLLVQFVWLRWSLLARSGFDRVFVGVRVLGAIAAAALVVYGWHQGEYLGWLRSAVSSFKLALGSSDFYIFGLVPLALFLLCWRFRLPWR